MSLHHNDVLHHHSMRCPSPTHQHVSVYNAPSSSHPSWSSSSSSAAPLVRRPALSLRLSSPCSRTQDVSFFQSFLGFRGAQRDSRASLVSFRTPAPDLASQNEFADDENSIFDEDDSSWNGSLLGVGERQGVLRLSSVGGGSLVGSLPSTPLGRLLPELRLDMFRTDVNVRTAWIPPCWPCAVILFIFPLSSLECRDC